MRIGAQLYTVHDFCQTLDDFENTLKKVADIGYEIVQVSGTCPYEGEWLKEKLDKYGLKCAITHIPYPKLTEDLDSVIKEHHKFDCKYIGLGGVPGFWAEDLKRDVWVDFSKDAVQIGQKIKDAGCYFMYHNHHLEFFEIDGDYAFKYMPENIPADLMGFTLDTYWVKVGGHDPVEWLKKLEGRTPCIHLKDMILDSDGKPKMAPVGKGVLDFEAITTVAQELGVEYALVEQDNCYGEDPFDCLRQSYNYLASLGLR